MALELTQEQKDAGWLSGTLEEFLTLIIDHRGKTPKKLGGDWSESGHRVISAINMKNSRVDGNGHHYVDDEIFAKWMKIPVAVGDVFLTSEAPMGAVAYISDHEATDWVVGQRIFALRADEKQLHGRYLYYLLQTNNMKEQLESRSSGTTVMGIKQAELRKVELILQPVEEQKRIAEILGSLDDKIEANSRLLDSLDELIRLEYLSSSDSSELKISDVSTEVKDGVSHAEIADNEVYVGLEHLPRHNVWLRDWGKGEDVTSSKSRFKRGDILFGKLRPYFHKVVVAPVDGICSTDIIVVRPEPGFETLALQALSSDEVVAHATNASNGTRMPRTKWADLKDFDTRSATGVLEPSYIDYTVSLIMENQRLWATRDHLIRHLIG